MRFGSLGLAELLLLALIIALLWRGRGLPAVGRRLGERARKPGARIHVLHISAAKLLGFDLSPLLDWIDPQSAFCILCISRRLPAELFRDIAL